VDRVVVGADLFFAGAAIVNVSARVDPGPGRAPRERRRVCASAGCREPGACGGGRCGGSELPGLDADASERGCGLDFRPSEVQRVAPDEALRSCTGRREDRSGNAPIELPCAGAAANGAELDLDRARVGESAGEGVIARQGAARFPVTVGAEVLASADGVVVRAD